MKTLSKKGPHPLNEFQRVLSVNVAGSFNVIRLVAEQMKNGEALNEAGEKGELAHRSFNITCLCEANVI